MILSRWRSLWGSERTGSSFALRFYRKFENKRNRGNLELRSSLQEIKEEGERYMHPSGLLGMTDGHKELSL